VSSTTLQLRVGVTRDKGFLYRACLRPPFSVTVGRDDHAVLRIGDAEAPACHTLFSVGDTACLLDFRPEWNLRVFRDGLAVSGQQLMEEGLAFRRGRRVLVQMAPGTRGSLRIGRTRLLFKWEAVPVTPIGEVPLQDVGGVPRCHACGLALRDALARPGLYARCDSCRSVCRFIDPDVDFRPPALRPLPHLPIDDSRPPGPEPGAADSQVAPALKEEADTLLGVPIFAPRTGSNLDPLPDHFRPAGVAGPPKTPLDIRAARAPLKALEGMRTVFARSPFLGPRPHGRTAAHGDPRPVEVVPPAPDRGGPAAVPPDLDDEVDTDADAEAPVEPLHAPDEIDSGLDEAFWTAELEALAVPQTVQMTALKPTPLTAAAPSPGEAPEPPPQQALDDQIKAPPSDDSVPWSTFSVLSAQADYAPGAGRIPHQLVEDALDDDLWRPQRSRWTWAALAIGAAVLVAIVLAFVLRPPPPSSPSTAEVAPVTPPADRGSADRAPPPAAPPALAERGSKASTSQARSSDLKLDRIAFGEGRSPRPGTDGGVVDVHTEPFALDRTEVTLGDYRTFLSASARPEPAGWSLEAPPTGAGTARLPVAGVSAADAVAYCAWAHGRLPAEAEWERAAAGADGRLFPWGDEFDPGRVAAKRKLEPVGSHPAGASDTGVLDLIGGVPEWVDLGPGSEAVLKGGGAEPWNLPEYLQIHARIPSGAERWTPGPGFRCAADR